MLVGQATCSGTRRHVRSYDDTTLDTTSWTTGCSVCLMESAVCVQGAKSDAHVHQIRSGHCEETWLPGPTFTPNSREERGQRAKHSKTGLVANTMSVSFLFCSVRGVSCLPGAQPGCCGSLEFEGSCSCRDRVQGAAVARALRVAPAAVLHPPFIDECYGASCVDFQAQRRRWVDGVQGAIGGQW
jgi:hypothetical protein